MVARVIGGRVPSSLDSVLAVKEELLDRELVLKGKFKDEIARLERAKADAEEKLGMIETVERASAVLREAEESAQKIKEACAGFRAEAEDLLAAAKSKAQAVEAKDAQVSARERNLAQITAGQQAMVADLEARERALKASQEAGARAAAEREAGLSRREAEQKTQAAGLAERERRLNERLESLKL